jgi:eukaryotic-like serine/threonine-protein kinase
MNITINTVIYGNDNEIFKVIKEIGSGAYGTVYKIEKENDKSVYALKTLPNFFTESNLQAFLNETKITLQVNNENVIKYYFIHNGSLYSELPPYIIMEYANQGTLKDIIDKHSKAKQFIDTDIMLNYFNQLINGMDSVNSKIIHRDIKPDNILVKDNILKITDFGLSKIIEEKTRTNTFKGIGHLMFMSPEGWNFEKNNIQMDIYSMGIAFYMLATLNYPYEIKNSANMEEWKNAHLFQTPKRPELINKNIGLNISQVIMKMIEKRITKRYKNWSEIRNDISKEGLKENSSDLLKEALNKRLLKDNELMAKKMEETKKYKEYEDFQKLIYFQFIEVMVKPVEDFINNFNENYIDGKIKFKYSDKPAINLSSSITLISGKIINTHVSILRDEDFYKNVPDEWGERTYKKLMRPQLKGKKIIAWGYIKSTENTGYNIILVENIEEIYGTWYLLTNTNNVFGRNPRHPEPFVFEFNELDKEIGKVGIMHIYKTDVSEFNVEEIIKFINKYI